MRSSVLRTAAVTLLAGLALLLGAGPAFAHTRLLGSDPADGASLDTSPQRVSLTFNESISPDFTQLTVVGPNGGHYETGAVSADDGTVSIGVQPLGPAGRYEIGYRVVSADGHPVTGSVAFTLTTPGPGTAGTVAPAQGPAAPAPPAAPPAGSEENSGGMPLWPWIVGAVVLVGAGVAVALRMGRTSAR
jgi:methionine-rich copper-binding protein CopC